MPPWLISVYAALCSFAVYFCMYIYRKPFSAAGFTGMHFLGDDYKIWLVSAQTIGYMLGKFYGIKLIAGMKGEKRAASILKLILASWASLLLFAVTPAPYNILFFVMNGFPLGIIWGLVFGYVEGRRATEFIGAVLCVNFIFSSGVAKSIGKSIVLNWHISESWMPFVAGALFVVPLVVCTWLLNHTPLPSAKDIQNRGIRHPMTASDRKNFLSIFLPGIVIIVTTYVLLTILRDFRDNFANELWTELGFGNQAAIFTTTEIPVSLIVLFCMSLLILVKNNMKAFLINHYIIMGGYALALVSTLLFLNKSISPVLWMTAIGTGLYLSYVPFNALYFERMIASYKVKSNVGFIIYIADSFGYLGSVLFLFLKKQIGTGLSWTSFFSTAIIIICIVGIAGTAVAAAWFRKKYSSMQLTQQTTYA
ncbi:DUF5690 family protein [Foetidibacter luteolus]|uniref:DUF5690 family protein n=1 Tax=Foetidibacter luteolus TaxID=2608880 RepID=UPI00129A5CEC|nr:DUF5690 family protein [Foetidibacter luteolus]